MNKSKKWLLSGLGALALTLMAAPVFAATYTAYSLPAFKGNNYTGAHGKTTTANYITNKVTALTKTDQVTFWACNNARSQLSNDYYQKLGNTSNIVHGKTQKGYQIIMGMENSRISTSTAFVSGNVNFR
ncbi:hypothetical protein ACFQ49_07965 [Kroppenstedtia eburnea]|uniref:hypothetical protein n=1 Tax=Kroppenstedtia eburnea TaxID=714067 RepID=UPI003637445B